MVLHREVLGDPSAPCLLLTHGMYGSGANWRTIGRKLVERRPDWSVALVDLRNHGRSRGAAPPHDLAACARDVIELMTEMPTITAFAGHSFGGKVVLLARSLAPVRLVQTWLFDATPSARPGHDSMVMKLLGLMDQMPPVWARREDFVAALVAEGYATPLANWLAMNVVPADDGDGMVLRLDLKAIREMLDDYYTQDLWHIAFDAILPGTVEVVIADGSTMLDAPDRARLESPPSHLHVHHINAGHWLHIEAPANVVELLVSGLPTSLQ